MTFAQELLDPDAYAVVCELQDAGYLAYFVGGSVRDLLLSRRPKDFDIVTDATPPELKELFGRRCRIIGRRFRLAHVRMGAQIFEVATFRGVPDDQEADEETDFVVRANTFGTPEEDAKSRDFTMNGLFYDPVGGELIDHIGGREDVEARVVRTIGDAGQRFREDPVRLLRAIKFASRLDMRLDDAIIEVAPETAPLLETCPAARVSEEFYRIAESGHASRAYELMLELGVVRHILPEEAAEYVEDLSPHLVGWLAELDRLTHAHGTLPRESTFAYVVWPVVQRRIEALEAPERSDWGELVLSTIEPLIPTWNIPVRHRQRLRGAARGLKKALHRGRGRRGDRGVFRSPSFLLCLSLLRSMFLRGEADAEIYDQWASATGVFGAPFEHEAGDSRDRDKRPGAGRRRRRGRRRDGDSND